MASKNRDTLHMYLDAAERGDWDGMRRCIGGSYTFIDHTTDVVARTPEEMQIAGEEALAWSDLRYENPQVHETTDGTLIVQATLTRTADRSVAWGRADGPTREQSGVRDRPVR
jgi:ketosteroid isomerase-like protein